MIETHAVKSHFLVRLSNRGRRPWIAFHHGYTDEDVKMRLYNQLDRWSLRRADRVVTVTSAFREILIRRGVPGSRISVLQSALAAEELGAAVAARRQGSDVAAPRTILAVGRLSPEKGHGDLIEALEIVRDRRPTVPLRLVIVGDGPSRRTLLREVSRRRVGAAVELVGAVNEIAPYYAAADLFVLPSRSEGSPHALLEAMASDLPIVATRVGGVPEMVADRDTALLVDPAAPKALAAAIEELLDQPALARRLAAAARERVRREFALGARARALLRIYSESAGRR